MNSHQLINSRYSGDDEYYTPEFVIEASRLTLGEIDLDPASSISANERVKAITFYTKDHDGLNRSWHGRVWMNHPFGKPLTGLGLTSWYPNMNWGRVTASCCISFAATSETMVSAIIKAGSMLFFMPTNQISPSEWFSLL